jgi:SAM-dependent methyltransferase
MMSDNTKHKDMWAEDNDANIRKYTELCNQFGDDHRALDWGSRESQHKRFRILSEIGVSGGDSILDVGCGLGDYYAWAGSNALADISYKGVDITPALIDAARQKYPKAQFDVSNILETKSDAVCDYAMASGIFAKRKADPFEFACAMIVKMCEISRKGVAFNSLNALTMEPSVEDTMLDPYEMLTFCRTISPWVTLRMDYHPNDFTIYVRRTQS